MGRTRGEYYIGIFDLGRFDQWNPSDEGIWPPKHHDTVWGIWDWKLNIYGIGIAWGGLIVWTCEETSCVHQSVDIVNTIWVTIWVETYALEGDNAQGFEVGEHSI